MTSNKTSSAPKIYLLDCSFENNKLLSSSYTSVICDFQVLREGMQLVSNAVLLLVIYTY